MSRYRPTSIPSSEITPEEVYLNRRAFMQKSVLLAAGTSLAMPAVAGLQPDDDITPEAIATSYNNFYEFGTDKGDPARYAHALTTDPWRVTVSGEAAKTGEFEFSDIIKGMAVEERIYRLRCVEAWSMVVPWMGIQLKKSHISC